ncbi:MAG: thioredoxin TrxC [Aestuariivirga sp.]|uniref:thioredoxin TrxC n=1 Tax=Aestuariivirga sp. TaxID=2650926 RepID=UPI0038D17270
MPQIVCPACGAINRIPPGKPAETARCGKCREPLFQGRPADLDGAGLARHITRDSIPLVVDFWADWCGPCKMMAPEFVKAAQALEPLVRFAKLDTEAAPEAAAAHGIRSIPTMMVFRNGREVARQSGAMPAGQIVQWLRDAVLALGS